MFKPIGFFQGFCFPMGFVFFFFNCFFKEVFFLRGGFFSIFFSQQVFFPKELFVFMRFSERVFFFRSFFQEL